MNAAAELNLQDLVFIDIETVPLVKKLEMDSDLFDSWAYKKRRDGLDDKGLVESFSKEAGLFPEFAKIVCISIGRVSGEELMIKSYSGHDEKGLLRDFNTDLNKVVNARPKTKFCGHAAIGFDIPFIFKRCLANSILPCQLLDHSGKKPWEVTVVDTKVLWQGTSFYPTSLINIAVALGLPSPKDDIDGSQVGPLYWSGEEDALSRITTYCQKDVITTANVIRKFRFEPVLKVNIVTEEPEGLQVTEEPLLARLNDGAAFGVKEKKKVKEIISNMESKKAAILLIEAIAVKKGTKVTKKFVEELKEEFL